MTDEIRQALEDGHIAIEDGLARCVGNEKLYLRLLKLFAADDHEEQIRREFEAGDVEAAERAVHSLKGTSGNLGVMELYNQAVEVDQMLKEGTWPPPAQTEAFFTELQRVKQAIQTAETRGA